MITCEECLERMYPDDPRTRGGPYRLCSCDYCGKPTRDRELEEALLKIKNASLPRPASRNLSTKEWGELQQVKSMVLHLQNKMAELSKKKREEAYEPF